MQALLARAGKACTPEIITKHWALIMMKNGYKQTEVGVIPEDWEVKKLGEIAFFASGTTPRRENHERYFQNGSVFWVKTMDLNNSEIYETSEKITEIALKETSSLKVFPIDTVLIAMYGGFNQIGRTGILKINACVNQALTAVQPNKNILIPLFLINFLNYRIDSWKDVATSSRKDPNITSKDIKDFFTVIPPISEQAAIATALGDVDMLISALDNLIAKKRLIKQGAMQELLSGKKRLADFSEEWKVKKLNEVTNITRLAGYEYSTIWEECENGEIIALRGFNIGKNRIIEKEFVNISNKLSMKLIRSRLFKGDVVYPCVGTIGNAAVIEDDDKYHIQQNIAKITPLKNILNSYFIAHYLMSSFGLKEIEKFNGTSSQPNILVGSLREYSIILPSFEEQTAIAQILSDMDTDILALETERNKTLAIKQGMMQELLTGKTRLI